jgi:ligand-binding SRPBCC domain-containing protein
MIRLELVTRITAPVERCFDLSRSIDAHLASTQWTGEQAIAGVISGLIGPGEEVTWQAHFFGVRVTHTSRITAYEFPNYFQDSMVRGAFRSYFHDHYFETASGGTVMKDVVEFSAPCGWLGLIAERLVLKRHLVRLLERRNHFIKRTAESAEWRQFLQS